MNHLLARHGQKLRFLIVGGGLTVLDFGLLFLFVHLGIDKIPANYLSTGLSFIVSFIVNRSFTFKASSNNRIRQFALFILVTAIALWVLQPLVIWIVMPAFGGLAPDLALFVAKLLATFVSLTWNYVFYAKVVFRKEKNITVIAS